MAKKAKTKDVAKKTIEQTLWDSANELRGNLDAAEYKSVVLGLVFLKYINDCFKVKHDELVAEGAGFEEDPDEYIGDNIFFVPTDARWDKIVKASLTAEIGVVIDTAMEALEQENRQLKSILPKNYARPELDKRRLGNVIDIFENNLHFTGTEARDVLGVYMNTSLESSLVKKVRKAVSSTLHHVLSAPLLRLSNPTKEKSLTRLVVREVCLYRVVSLSNVTEVISTKFLFTGRNSTATHGNWHK